MPKCIVHFHKNKYKGWLFPWLCSSGSYYRCACCKHHSCHLKGEKNKLPQHCNCYCKLLCCWSSTTDNWPLMNLAQHCLAAVLSQTAYCFCFWGFSHAHPVTAEGLSSTTQLTSHSELWLCYEALFSLHVFVYMGTLKCLRTSMHIYVLAMAGRICLICGSKPRVEGPEAQVEENWNGLRNSEQSKHKSKTSSGKYSRLESHLLSL